MNIKKAVSITTAMAGLTGGLLVFSVGQAQAATRCTVTPNARTSNLKLGHNGVVPYGGTVYTKTTAYCNDLNLNSVSDSGDAYEGWLLHSNGQWLPCTRGFVAGTNLPQVLCSDVAVGTQMQIVQESNTQRTVTAEY
jgi:hypothetical protein